MKKLITDYLVHTNHYLVGLADFGRLEVVSITPFIENGEQWYKATLVNSCSATGVSDVNVSNSDLLGFMYGN